MTTSDKPIHVLLLGNVYYTCRCGSRMFTADHKAEGITIYHCERCRKKHEAIGKVVRPLL